MPSRSLRGISLLLASSLGTLLASVSASAQSGEIRGRVADAGAAPVESLGVQLEAWDGGVVATTTTGTGAAAGEYAFAGLADGVYLVKTWADPGRDLVSQYYAGVNEFDRDLARRLLIAGGNTIGGVDFVLGVGGTLAGTLGGLLPGQSVEITVSDADSRRYRGSTGSDPDAFTYVLRHLPPGRYRVEVRPWGTDRAFQYWSGRTSFAQADVVTLALNADVSGIDFTLSEGTSIAGTLTLSPPGDPAAMWVEALESGGWQWVTSTQPNADGTYTLANLPPGSYKVQVQTSQTGYVREFWAAGRQDVEDYNEATPITVSVGAPATDIDFALESGHSISGHAFLDLDGDRVQDAGERDLVDVNVWANLFEGCCGGNGTRTDGAGDYSIIGLRPGRYRVQIQSSSPDEPFVEEYWNGRSPFDATRDAVDVTTADATGVDFDPVPGDVVTGTVFADLDADGVRDAGEPPVSGNGNVRAFDAATGRCCTNAPIGADGRYALALPPGSFLVQATTYQGTLLDEYWHDAFFRGDATAITPPLANVDFSLVDGAAFGTLRGRVVQPGGLIGVAGVDVGLQRFDTDEWVGGTRTASDGAFAFERLPPGAYKVSFDTQYSNTAHDQDFVGVYWTRCQDSPGLCLPGVIDPNDFKVTYPATPAPPGGPGSELGTFELDAGGSVSGTVDVPAGHSPPSGLSVYAQSFVSGGTFQPFLPGAGVAADGSYRLRGLPAPSSYKVRAEAYDSDFVPVYYRTQAESTFDNRLAGAVDVAAGVNATGIDLHLFVGGSLSGHVTCAADGSPVENFPINVNLRDPGGFNFWGHATSVAGGGYSVRGLPAGDYEVRADSRGFDAPCGSLANAYYPTLVHVAPGADTPGVDFALEAEGRIEGTVTQLVDGAVQPVVNLRVSALDFDSGRFVSDDHTDASGHYAIRALRQRAGVRYRVQVETRDSDLDPQFFNFVRLYWNQRVLQGQADPVALSGPTPVTDVDFALALGGMISGTVVADVGGTPLSGVNVCVAQYASNWNLNCNQTDPNGFYIVRGLPADSYRVSANASPLDYAFEYFDDTRSSNAATPVVVAASTPAVPVPVTPNVNFGLAPTGSVAGSVRDANGDPIANLCCVNANSLTPGGGAGTSTRSDGTYVIRGVPPGLVRVTAGGGSTPYAFEAWNNRPDNATADPVRVTAGATASGIDFVLAIVPRLLSGPSPASGARGTTVNGVQVSADRLAGDVCAAVPVPPCARVDLGPGLTVVNAGLSGGVFTFDVQIAVDAPLGARGLSLVNDFALEDAAAFMSTAFEVTAGATPPAPGAQRVYVADTETGRLRVYGADLAPLGPIDTAGLPDAVALAPDGAFAFVAGSRVLSVIDTRLGQEVTRVTALGSSGANALAVSARHVYAVNREAGSNTQVQVFDRLTWQAAGPITVGLNPFALRLDPLARWVYVANQSSASVSVIDVNPASPTLHTVLATVPLPAGVSPRGLAFTPDGARAYVVTAGHGTFLIDTARALGAPAAALVDVDGDPSTGLAAGSQTGISALPTRGGGQGLIDVVPLPDTPGTVLAYVGENNGAVRVIDVSSVPERPAIVRTVPSAAQFLYRLRAAPDGTRVFLGYGTSKDLFALDSAGLLASPATTLVRFERDLGPGAPFLGGGMAVGPAPGAVPATAPQITSVGPDVQPVRNGAPIAVTIAGARFAVGDPARPPVVSLQGTHVRGSVDLPASTSASLRVTFPPATPAGSYRVVVSNVLDGGNESDVSAASLDVEPAAAYAPSQLVYVTSDGRGGVTAYEPGGTRAVIATQPEAGGLALTPDGRRGVVQQLYGGPQPDCDVLPDQYVDLAVFDLDPASPTFRQVVANLPYVLGGFESPAVTPNPNNPQGVFAYVPTRLFSDTVAVIDPAAGVELDLDGNPATQTYPSAAICDNFDIGSKLSGLNRVELDADVLDLSLTPFDAALTPDGDRLYVANNTGSVSIVDTATRGLLGRLTFDGERSDGNLGTLLSIAVSPDGAFVYVSGNDSSARPYLFVYNVGVDADVPAALAERFALPTTPLAEIGRGMVVSPDGGTVYLAARLRGEIYALDVRPGSPTRGQVTRLPVGVGVSQLALAPDDGLLYALNVFRDELYVLDIRRTSPTYHQVLTTLGAPLSASDVAVQASLLRPRVASVSPAASPTAGGTPVVLVGANFVAGAGVTFAGEPATGVSVIDAFTIHATTPPGAVGAADVRVTNPDAQFGLLPGRFHYQSDTTPPVFTTPPYVAGQAIVGGTVSAEIRWTTDEPASSRVDYGTTPALGDVAGDASLVSDHVVMLTGLPSATGHEFRATSIDGALPGNVARAPLPPATLSFTTLAVPDTTPPVIVSGPTVSATSDSALVQWQTHESATSEVEFDDVIDGSVAPPPVAGAAGTSHSVALAGLPAATWHEYRVLSRDPSGNETVSAVRTFRTAPVPDTTPPVITSGPSVSYLSNDLVIVTWRTNEPATSFVGYGVYSIDEQGVASVTPVTTHVVFLTNLLPGTAYGFQAGSSDPSGNTVLTADPFGSLVPRSGIVTLGADRRVGQVTLHAGSALSMAAAAMGFTTAAAPDTTPPALTAPLRATLLSFDRALVVCGTDEAASLHVRFGAGALDQAAFDPGFTTTPGLLLAGLQPATAYVLEIVLTDPKGNALALAAPGFTTPAAPDATPPTLAALVAIALDATSARVAWTSDEPADATVRFGLIGGMLEWQVGVLGLATSHELLLTGLRPGSAYTVQAESRDSAGNPGVALTAFSTPFAAPEISAVTPAGAVPGVSLNVVVAGSAFEAGAQADFGAGVLVNAHSVSLDGTRLVANVSLATDAAPGVRTLRVTNPLSGLASTAVFTVLDTLPPLVTITEPAEGAALTSATVVVRGTVSEPAVVSVNGVSATVTPALAFEATLTLPGAGAHTLTASAVDAAGNVGGASVHVNVNPSDTTPPSLTLAATPSRLWPPNHRLVPVTITVSVSDDHDPAPAVVLVSAVSSEPDDARGGGDGNTVGDIQGAAIGTDDREVLLRAERDGGGPGRVYTLTYRATDQAGNSTQRSVQVLVPHDGR